MKYETGATTHGANDIVLSVLNDGRVYADRCHAIWQELQGYKGARKISFRDLCNAEANRQRRDFGSKFKAAEITEAEQIMRANTLEHVLESLRDDYDNARNILVNGRKWRDNVNGNTYFSCHVQVPCKSVDYRAFNIPYQYGYGDQWQWEAKKVLEKIGLITPSDKYMRELPINWQFDGVMRKRDMYDGIYL